MSITIAIQGNRASFHDIAARQYFGTDTTRIFCDTFSAMFAALADDRADFALCAIENSLYGSINEVYDLLRLHDFPIVGEVYLRIEQCLIGHPDAQLEVINEVYSHPVALAQCDQYLDAILPDATRVEYHDTAASVELIANQKNVSHAAIAGRDAAELYGMKILASAIETDPQNYTRFVVLAKQPQGYESATKTSLVLKTNHTPGALHSALGSFANRHINLTKLQSRPITGSAWNYIFYIDVSAGCETPDFRAAHAELIAQGCDVTILGSYTSGLLS